MTNREEKFDVSQLQICEMMGLVSLFRKEQDEKSPLAKNQPSGGTRGGSPRGLGHPPYF